MHTYAQHTRALEGVQVRHGVDIPASSQCLRGIGIVGCTSTYIDGSSAMSRPGFDHVRELLGGRHQTTSSASVELQWGVLAVLEGFKPSYLYDGGRSRSSELATAVMHISSCLNRSAAVATCTAAHGGIDISTPAFKDSVRTGRVPEPCAMASSSVCSASPDGSVDMISRDRALNRLAVVELLETSGSEHDVEVTSDWEESPATDALAQFVSIPGRLCEHLDAVIRSLSRHDSETSGHPRAHTTEDPAVEQMTYASSCKYFCKTVLVHVGDDVPRPPTTAETDSLCSALRAVVSALHVAHVLDSVPIVRVHVDKTWPLVALVGVLLGYPVTYLSGAHGTNCLSGRDLQRWTLSCTASSVIEDKRAVSVNFPVNHCVTAFTVPVSDADSPDVVTAIAAWCHQVESNAEKSVLVSNILIESVTVNHPSVAL